MQPTQARRTTAIQKAPQQQPKAEHSTLTSAEATFLERGYFVPDAEAMANLLEPRNPDRPDLLVQKK